MNKGRWIGGLVLAVGVLCVTLGVLDGQMKDVFRKAIFICLECIGIG